MNIKKTLLAISLFTVTLLCIVTFLVLPASAEVYSGDCGAEGDNVKWSLDTETGVLEITGSGEMADYEVDSTESNAPWNSYRDYIKTVNIENGVTTIGNSAFYYCRSLTSVAISESVISIGEESFSTSDSLTSIEIPNSITSIGYGAFSYCLALTNVTFSANSQLTHIDSQAFGYCESLTSILIPSSVTDIGWQVFIMCFALTNVKFVAGDEDLRIMAQAFNSCSSLTSIVIPRRVIEIGDSAFGFCTSLTSIAVEEGNLYYHVAGNCLIETASKTLLKGFNDSVIPMDGSVVKIATAAFAGCEYLTDITIPNGITRIADHAFSGCGSLTDISIPNSVTSVGRLAFAGCNKLNSVTISNNMTQINEHTFSQCYSLTHVEFAADSKLTTISEGAFFNCGRLTAIDIPITVTRINKEAFLGCGLTAAYYHGTQTDWSNNVVVGTSNNTLLNALVYVDHTYGEFEPYNETQHKQACECGVVLFADHNWNDGEIITAPTEKAEGLKRYTCTVCNSHNDERIEPIGINIAPTENDQDTEQTLIEKLKSFDFGCQSLLAGGAVTLIISTATALAFIPKKKKRE